MATTIRPIDQTHSNAQLEIVLHVAAVEILFRALKMPLDCVLTLKAIFEACLKHGPSSHEAVPCPAAKIGRLLRPEDEQDKTDEAMGRLGRRALSNLVDWQEKNNLQLIDWQPGGLTGGILRAGTIRIPFLGYAEEVIRLAQRHPKYSAMPTYILEEFATVMMSKLRVTPQQSQRPDFRKRAKRRAASREAADVKSIQRALDRARADGVDLSAALPVILTEEERGRLSKVSNSDRQPKLSIEGISKNEGSGGLGATLKKLQNGPTGSQKFEILILVAGEIRGRIETATEPDSAAVSACLEMLQSAKATRPAPGSLVFGSETEKFSTGSKSSTPELPADFCENEALEKFSTGKNLNLSACMYHDSGQKQPDDSSLRPTTHDGDSAHTDAVDESGLLTDSETVNEFEDASIEMLAENDEIETEPEWLSDAPEIALAEPESVEAGEIVLPPLPHQCPDALPFIKLGTPRPSSPRSDDLHAVALASLAEENHQTQHVATETDPACADCVRDRVFVSLDDYARQCGRYMQKFLIAESWNACGGAAAAPIRFDLLRLAYQKARDRAEQARRYQIE